MSARFTCNFVCEKCNAENRLEVDVPWTKNVNKNCGRVSPSGVLQVFVISSDQIGNYLSAKVRAIKPDGVVFTQALYTEPALRSWEQHRGYAVLKVSFSPSLIKQQFEGIGADWLQESVVKQHLIDRIELEIFKKYRLSRDDFKKNYEEDENRLERFGITKSYAETVRQFLDPKLRKSSDGRVWLFTVMTPAEIIKDMLADDVSGKLEGDIQIVDVKPIDNDHSRVNFVVHQSDRPMDNKANNDVLKILSAIGKKK